MSFGLKPDGVAVIGGAIFAMAAVFADRRFMNGDFLMAGFCGAWLGVGLLAVVRAELSLRGRHGPATTWRGATARVLGATIVIAAVLIMSYWSHHVLT